MENDLLGAFEAHSPDEIRSLLSSGASPTVPIKGKRPIDSLIESYLRSPRFAECLQVLLDAGASIGDPLLQAVLMDDDRSLRHQQFHRAEADVYGNIAYLHQKRYGASVALRNVPNKYLLG